ncbi:TPA: phage antirepressor KilAC domain-containing protein [Staphylococcus aureus]|nr:phage antirepressor KilAC domain-containing protein [Staphylococcus aureus]
MQELQTFNFEELPVNTLTIENEPYVVGNEVAKILGYSNYRNAINNHVEDEDKLRTQIRYAGQLRTVTLINESGLYSLIFDASKQSKNEKIRETARKFKRWVTSDVLPAIRKHGIYATDNVIEQTLKDPDYIITVLTEYKKEKEQNLLLQQEIGELKPKADYVDEILKSTGTLATTQIAADYGISAQKLNKLLHEARLQRKVNKQWVLYSEHMGKSYTESDTIPIVRSDGREDTVLQTRWTQKGRLKIHEIMTEFGYEANLGGA